MSPVHIQTPSRLHFGLLGWGPGAPRQFGGVGLMIDEPGIELVARPAAAWSADGPLAERVLRVAHFVAPHVGASTLHFEVLKAPGEHLGLGVGTQLSLAVAQAMLHVAGASETPVEELARWTGRGLRSGIGLHGFRHGGLIVDGGRGPAGGIPPLLARLEFPPEWSVLIVTPRRRPGLHGPEEANAFASLPPLSERVTERLCRAVLLGIMPAVLECDLDAFGRALSELQEEVGRSFAPAQGGMLASPESGAIVAFLRASGLHGVGQSSWGPTLYGFSDAGAAEREAVARKVAATFELGEGGVLWTSASRRGFVVS